MNWKKNLMMLTLFTQSACSVFGIRSVETPAYEVVEQEGSQEIRSYPPHIVAKTRVKGDYTQAQRQGFKILAAYIFGANEKKKKLPMTSPVIQEKNNESQRIAMTAPVSLVADKDAWEVTFVMPSQYRLVDLPIPSDTRVVLEEIPSKLMASIRYSGGRGVERNSQKAEELKQWLKTKNTYSIFKGPSSAGYDPPWTLPFFRRNEIHFELTKQAQEIRQ